MLRDDNGLSLEDNPPRPAVPHLFPIGMGTEGFYSSLRWVWRSFCILGSDMGRVWFYYALPHPAPFTNIMCTLHHLQIDEW